MSVYTRTLRTGGLQNRPLNKVGRIYWIIIIRMAQFCWNLVCITGPRSRHRD